MSVIRNLGRFSLASLIVLGLSGCGSSPTTDPGSDAQSQLSELDIESLLARAQRSQSPQKEVLLLQAAGHLQQREQTDWARSLLNRIDPELLDRSHFFDYTLLFSQLALDDDAYFLAQRILTNSRLDQQWQHLTREQQIILRQRRAELFMILGEPADSIAERLALEPLLADTEQSHANQDRLWQALMSMPVSELQRHSRATENATGERDQVLHGWYRLALISKNNQADLDKQLQQINRWVALWPEHPASLRLPEDLQLLQQLIAERPQQIALLLPQQGPLAKAGRAVRDGFMAAYYQARSQQSQTPGLRIYDTAETDVIELYMRALDDGASLVIGPLDKDRVSQLSQLPGLPVPTLALNYVDDNPSDSGDTESADNLYQFGLSVVDEARQIARRAWVEGHRHAMILAPDANWGQRSAYVFRQAWEELGGQIIDQSQFGDNANYSSVIKQGLNIDQSENRYRQLRGILNRPLEFEPRRRQDVDMLFLVARPSEARQIKPTLAFHYAADLPVYATSNIYSGTPDRKSDSDLNGIKFSTLPWFFDDANPIKTAIQEAADPAPSYQRLYALGVDSFHLYPRLKQLEQSAYARLYGVTGALSMTPERRLEREQIWARIRNGRAALLPMVVSHN